MPVQYSGILAEVRAVRTASGIFDVSHMGRLYISGTKATEFLEWILTAPVATLAVGRARYSFICNEAGGIIDDTIFYRLDENRYLLVPNAGNRNAVVAWFQRWVKDKFANDCNIEDMTESSALIAFQGPSTADVMSKLGGAGDPLPKPFSWANFSLQGKQVLVGRTGYTGEDGFEIVAGSADAVAVWQALLDSGAVPCGLGARDVLRLEAGLPLHGHEIDEHTSPVEAGLDRFVSFDKEYVGAPLLKEQRESGVQRKLVGLKLPGRSAPREGYPVLHQGQQIGQVTSGTYSPTLDTSIAMGYVLWRHAALGQALDLDIRGRIAEATVVPLPFYSRPRRAL
jgi:aminomethyltransferase